MFGFFESNDKKVERLHQEFLSYLDVVVVLPDQEREKVLAAIGTLLYGLQSQGLGDPLQVRGDAALKMAKHLRMSAKSFSSQTALCYKILATTVEAGGIESDLTVGFRAQANVVYNDAKRAYLTHAASKK